MPVQVACSANNAFQSGVSSMPSLDADCEAAFPGIVREAPAALLQFPEQRARHRRVKSVAAPHRCLPMPTQGCPELLLLPGSGRPQLLLLTRQGCPGAALLPGLGCREPLQLPRQGCPELSLLLGLDCSSTRPIKVGCPLLLLLPRAGRPAGSKSLMSTLTRCIGTPNLRSTLHFSHQCQSYLPLAKFSEKTL